jgi:pimeloyl-ACP methyl ester carboxylesterase
MARMSYGLLRRRWFARLQAKSLCLPDSLFAEYYADSLRISKATLISTLTSNGTYALPPSLTLTHARALVLAGEKELAAMRKSARLLHATIPDSELAILPGMKHGELSLLHPADYAARLLAFFERETSPTA